EPFDPDVWPHRSRRGGVSDDAVGGGLDRPVPLAVGVRLDGERGNVTCPGEGAAVGGAGRLADLDREVDRGLRLEHGDEGGELFGGDVTGRRERAASLTVERPGGRRAENRLVHDALGQV